jgi:hypothetical protein
MKEYCPFQAAAFLLKYVFEIFMAIRIYFDEIKMSK